MDTIYGAIFIGTNKIAYSLLTTEHALLSLYYILWHNDIVDIMTLSSNDIINTIIIIILNSTENLLKLLVFYFSRILVTWIRVENTSS